MVRLSRGNVMVSVLRSRVGLAFINLKVMNAGETVRTINNARTMTISFGSAEAIRHGQITNPQRHRALGDSELCGDVCIAQAREPQLTRPRPEVILRPRASCPVRRLNSDQPSSDGARRNPDFLGDLSGAEACATKRRRPVAQLIAIGAVPGRVSGGILARVQHASRPLAGRARGDGYLAGDLRERGALGAERACSRPTSKAVLLFGLCRGARPPSPSAPLGARSGPARPASRDRRRSARPAGRPGRRAPSPATRAAAPAAPGSSATARRGWSPRTTGRTPAHGARPARCAATSRPVAPRGRPIESKYVGCFVSG